MTVKVYTWEQYGKEWYETRAGLPTASQFHCILAKGEGKTRRKYLMKLLGEQITRKSEETYSNGHMERGKIMEEEARNLYAFLNDVEPESIGFMTNDIAGCSPDAGVGANGLLEIKTRLQSLQCELLLDGRVPNEHKAQIQGELWISEREFVDFFSYCPGLKPFQSRVYRDERYISELKIAVEDFNAELQELKRKIA